MYYRVIALVFVIFALQAVLPVSAGETSVGRPGCSAVKEAKYVPLTEHYADYIDADGIYGTKVYEYTDAIIIEKTAADFIVDVCVKVNAPFFTGKAEKHDWILLPVKFPENSEQDKYVKHGVYAERDKIYSVNNTDEGVQIVALITEFTQFSPTVRMEQIVVDTITTEKIDGKTVILRKTVPAQLSQSANVRELTTPTPAEVELLTDNIIRLRYDDGCIEHWKLTLTPKDIRNNTALYKGDDEVIRRSSGYKALVWTNDKGIGSRGVKNSKAWDFDPDASREPVYEGQDVAAPETAASAKHMNVFSGLLARISGFFRGLFGNA